MSTWWPRALLIVALLLVVAPSVIVPWWTGRDLGPLLLTHVDASQQRFADALHEGWLAERSGDVDGALAAYQRAQAAPSAELFGVADAGVQRVLEKRAAVLWPEANGLRGFSVTWRLPALVGVLVVFWLMFLSRVPARGIAISPFEVTDATVPAQVPNFAQALANQLALASEAAQDLPRELERLVSRSTSPRLSHRQPRPGRCGMRSISLERSTSAARSG